jgi:ribosomal protein S18 acetylase RimI-like enzyme
MSKQEWLIRVAESDQDWTSGLKILASVYVEEGYTQPEAAFALFKRDCLQGHGDFLLGINAQDEILGAVLLLNSRSKLKQIASEAEVEFRLLGVAPSARRAGLGRVLVEECMRRAKTLGIHRIVLSTQPSMRTAQRLYERLGFVRHSDRDWRTDSGGERLVYVRYP